MAVAPRLFEVTEQVVRGGTAHEDTSVLWLAHRRQRARERREGRPTSTGEREDRAKTGLQIRRPRRQTAAATDPDTSPDGPDRACNLAPLALDDRQRLQCIRAV
ncbi:hypothetical protein [Jiangella alkaliphila]|uniref:hypothetical protein n=1 Tax=Jiangella alkaliphila TaxID=419479 RepID=UPI00128B0028|nr:hypothetical protein [Jiangella alkaliphila]